MVSGLNLPGDLLLPRFPGRRCCNNSQPDIAVLKPRKTFYRDRHPTPEDTLLVIEVSDTTLRYDRNVKVPLYARHGIPEVWIVDLESRRIHFFHSPSVGTYTDLDSSEQPGVTPITALPAASVDLSDLFTS
jgi:Uma2 family endonuclease